MCGIAGLVGRTPEPGVLGAMSVALAHRGPDDVGELVQPDASFVFRRLSIIDVAHGHQPLTSETGRCSIVLNGEVYNHSELRPALAARGH